MKRVQVWRFEMENSSVVEVEVVQSRDEPSPVFELTMYATEPALQALGARGTRTYVNAGLAYTSATQEIAEHGRIERVVEVPEEQFEPAEYTALLGELRGAVRAWKRQAGVFAGGVDPDAMWPELHDQLAASDVIMARQKRAPSHLRQRGQMLRQAISRYGNIMVWECRRQHARPGQPPRRGEYKWTLNYIQAALQDIAELAGARVVEGVFGQVIRLDDFRRRQHAV